jgi:hypothetical protein
MEFERTSCIYADIIAWINPIRGFIAWNWRAKANYTILYENEIMNYAARESA